MDFPPHFVLLSTERERRRKTDRHYHIITEWIFLQTNTSVSRQIETNTKSILQDTFYKDASFPETHSPNCIALWKLQGSFAWGSMELSFAKHKPGNYTDWQVHIFGGVPLLLLLYYLKHLLLVLCTGIYFCIETCIFKRSKIRRMLVVLSWWAHSLRDRWWIPFS